MQVVLILRAPGPVFQISVNGATLHVYEAPLVLTNTDTFKFFPMDGDASLQVVDTWSQC